MVESPGDKQPISGAVLAAKGKDELIHQEQNMEDQILGSSTPITMADQLKLLNSLEQSDSPTTPRATKTTFDSPESSLPHEENATRSFNDDISFTSQQETAEIRGQLTSLDERLKVMEHALETLSVERKGLTAHLDRNQADINKQLTILLDKFHVAMEQPLHRQVLNQASNDVQTLTKDSDGVFTQLGSDLSSEPSKTSVTSGSKPIPTSKRKVRLVV